MRRSFIILAAALALTGSVARAPTAWACSCIVGSSTETLFKHADAVFVGTVSTVSAQTPDAVARVSVSGVYKGTVPSTAEVRTALTVADCGVSFVPGGRYALFASTKTGVYRVDLCGGTTSDVGMLARAGFHPGTPASGGADPSDASGRRTERAGPLAGAALLIVVTGVAIVLRRRARAVGDS